MMHATASKYRELKNNSKDVEVEHIPDTKKQKCEESSFASSILWARLTAPPKEKKKIADTYDITEYECVNCHNKYSIRKELIDHIRRSHSLHKCPHCPLSYTYQKYLNHLKIAHAHMKTQTKSHELTYKDFIMVNPGAEPKYGCRLCDYQSPIRVRTIYHTRRHVRKVTCPKCGLILSDPEALEAHKSQPHPKLKIFCKICKKEFADMFKHESHKQHNHELAKCRYCSERVVRKDLDKHMLQLHRDSLPTCGVCGLKATSNCKIIKHQKIVHLKEKNVSCPICNFPFYNEALMKKHMLTHTGEKLESCRFCKKKFTRRSTRNLHEKIHTGEKNKVCTVCGAAFVQKASLNYHMIKHHPGDV